MAEKGAQDRKETRGRPPLFKSPEALQKAVDAYFVHCAAGRPVEVVTKAGTVITVTKPYSPSVVGLALALGFTNRESLGDYCTRKVDSEFFAPIIMRAKARIEEQMVQGGLAGEYEPKVLIRILSANFGYADKQEQKHSGDSENPVQVTGGLSPDAVDAIRSAILGVPTKPPKPGGDE